MRRTISIIIALIALLTGLAAAHRAWSDEQTLEATRFAATPVARESGTPLVLAAAVPQKRTPNRAVQVDPYAEWQNWCEPLDYDRPCKTHDDCSDIQHVSRRGLRCAHPYWAVESPDYKICAPGYSTRQERVWRKTRLREIVAQAFFPEAEHCADWIWRPLRSKRGNVLRYDRVFANGRPLHRQYWKCTQQQALAEKLSKFLNAVYSRETSKRPWKRHRLDIEPNKEAWIKEASAYGWKLELVCMNGRKKCRQSKKRVSRVYPDPMAKQHNPHYEDRWRWRYGLGGYGKNSAYGTQDWDMMAPPEILCLEVPGTEAYLRDARLAVHKYTSAKPPTCKGEPYRGRSIDPGSGQELAKPSWIDVHRVASGAKWCPRAAAKEAKFRARAVKVGLDPDEPVTLRMLGAPLPRDRQNQIAQRVLARLERVLPPPWSPPVVSSDG